LVKKVIGNLVYSDNGTLSYLFDMQYHTDLAYDSATNSVTATVSDYLNAVQTTWTDAITFDNNRVAQSVVPTNGVATVVIDPNVSGEITVATTVSGIRNGSLTFTPNTLLTVQASKYKELRAGYAQTIATGFAATVGGTLYTFGWSTDDKATLADTQSSVDRGFLAFPFQYADIQGHPVPISAQADLDAIESTATKFFNAQHQQVLTLIGNVKAVTTIDDANAIQWAQATY